jgi:prepilin-type N-terminal cleavage/methylation domain-containing protein
MKKGFTLIELIFAIVIIGVLAAVAVPKFTNLKGNAEVNNIIKIAKDAESSVPSAAVNMSDLENNSTYVLSDILSLSGTGITYRRVDANIGEYTVEEAGGTGRDIVTITFDRANRTLNVNVDCSDFKSTDSQDKCKGRFDSANDNFDGTVYDNTISF